MTSTPHLRQPDASHVRQEWDTIADNALRLDRDAAEQLVAALNSEVSGLYILFNQVRKHYWIVEGALTGETVFRVQAVLDSLTDRRAVYGTTPIDVGSVELALMPTDACASLRLSIVNRSGLDDGAIVETRPAGGTYREVARLAKRAERYHLPVPADTLDVRVSLYRQTSRGAWVYLREEASWAPTSFCAPPDS